MRSWDIFKRVVIGLWVVMCVHMVLTNNGNLLICFVWFYVTAILLIKLLEGVFREKNKMEYFMKFVVVAVITVMTIFSTRYLNAMNLRKLEGVYDQLVAAGAPFPEKLDPALYDLPSDYIHWYYQKNAESGTFGLVHGSNSDYWVMQYPKREWEFVGFSPERYEPGKVPYREYLEKQR